MSQGTPENAPGDGMGPVMPAQAGDMRGAYAALMQAPDAGLRQAGMQGQLSMAQQQAQATQQAAERQRKTQALQTLGPVEAVRQGIVTLQEAEGFANAQNIGVPKVARTAEIAGPNGEKLIQSFDDRGNAIGQPVPAYLAPVQVNRGNVIEFVTPTAGQQLTVGMSPSESANLSLRGRELNLRAQEIQNKPERQVTVLDTETGNAVLVNESDAIGSTRYTPQAASQVRERITRDRAKKQMNTALMELKSQYDALREGGGIVSQSQGPVGNVMARISASGPGQTAGGAVGTKNQMARDMIEQTRPLLLNLIKEATGMSAQQMNSNAEMQLYLRAATDPTLSYEANINALDNLDKMFGLGLGVSGRQPPKKPGSLGSGTFEILSVE
jgi:hypothetical protein